MIPSVQTGQITSPSKNPFSRTLGRDLLLLALAIGAFFALFLGSRPLSVPDEGRYVEIPREMVVTGDWLTPRLNGVKYFEKPPLFYWFEALLIRLFGLSEWSVRTGPAFFALIGCLAVAYAGNRLFGRRAGIFSAAVLSTSLLYYALGRTITLDMPVSALLTVSLLAFLLGTREPAGLRRRMLFYVFYSAAALAVLAKGLIGIVFPAMIIGAWVLVMNEWRLLRSIYLPTGLLLFLAVAVPWHVLVNRANPEFFQFYFIHEHFQRYLTTVHSRYKPFWFFIPVLLGGLLPWTAFLAQAVRHSLPCSWKERHQHRETVFLILWAGLIFLFFSRSDSKLIPYILPVLPPLALIIGKYLADAWENDRLHGIRLGMSFLLVIDVLFIAALLLAHRFREEIDIHGLRPHLFALAAVLFLGAVGAWMLRRRSGRAGAITALIASTVLFLTLSNTIMPYVDTRSIKEMALELRPQLRPGDEVISYFTYYQDLPVYLERTVTIAGWQGELDFGVQQEDASRWIIDDRECWNRWNGENRVFLVTSKTIYDTFIKHSGRKHHLLDETQRDVLLCNKGAHP